jgi:predicted nucleotidyltransferase
MLQKSSMLTTGAVFFRSPTKAFTLTDVSRESKLAHTSTKENLRKLIALRLIQKTIEKKGTRKFPKYMSSRTTGFVREKRLYNFYAIEESGIIQYLEEKIMPKCIVLFGSYRRGEDTEQSDIDLFVESKQQDADVKSFERKLQRPIQLHFNSRFMEYPTELKNDIINGTVLHGFLEGYV